MTVDTRNNQLNSILKQCGLDAVLEKIHLIIVDENHKSVEERETSLFQRQQIKCDGHCGHCCR